MSVEFANIAFFTIFRALIKEHLYSLLNRAPVLDGEEPAPISFYLILHTILHSCYKERPF